MSNSEAASIDSVKQKFQKKFEKSLYSKDIEPIKFLDGKGYSIVGSYPDSLKRRMGVPKDANYVPMYKFYLDFDNVRGEYVPLFASVATTYEQEEGGRKQYLLTFKRIRRFRPMDLNTRDDFYVKKSSGEVYEFSKNIYKKTDYTVIYDRMRRMHNSDILDPRALFYRLKFLLLRIVPSLALGVIAYILGLLVWYIKGYRYRYDVLMESLRDSEETNTYNQETKTIEGKIDFFGYKVAVWTIFTYSLIILAINILIKHEVEDFFKIPGVTVIAAAIVTIILYDKVLPYISTRLIKWMSIVSYDLKYKQMRINI